MRAGGAGDSARVPAGRGQKDAPADPPHPGRAREQTRSDPGAAGAHGHPDRGRTSPRWPSSRRSGRRGCRASKSRRTRAQPAGGDDRGRHLCRRRPCGRLWCPTCRSRLRRIVRPSRAQSCPRSRPARRSRLSVAAREPAGIRPVTTAPAPSPPWPRAARPRTVSPRNRRKQRPSTPSPDRVDAATGRDLPRTDLVAAVTVPGALPRSKRDVCAGCAGRPAGPVAGRRRPEPGRGGARNRNP